MAFKFNIGDKGKSFKVESESEAFIGMKIGEKFDGKEIFGDLNGYELEIRGTSDKSGFAGSKGVEGPALNKILIKKGKFLRKVPHKGFRRKKTVRGNEISAKTVQINCVVSKAGGKTLEEVFPEQAGKKEEKKE